MILRRRFIDFEAMAKLFMHGPVNAPLGRDGRLVHAAMRLAFEFLLPRFLYSREIFLRA